MKFFKQIFAVLVIVLCSNLAAAQKQKIVEKALIKTSIYCNHCAKCETCGERFQKVLLREKGIQMVTVDDKEMTIEVVYNTKKTDLTKVKTAITRLGYDADEMLADEVAYEGLDNCCKK